MANNISEVLTSTNYLPTYSLENLFKSFEIAYADGTVEYRKDYLGSDIARLIKNIKEYAPVKYDGTTPLTTLVYKFYGTTTITPIVTMYNGIHALELIPGKIIKFPDLSSLAARLQRSTQVNNIGKTIII
jgi:hypothetical protein